MPEVRSGGDLAALGDSISLAIIRVVAPRRSGLEPGVFAGVPLTALKAFLQGEAAFARDQWALAQRQYEEAVGIDSTFALADWRLANVKRWRRVSDGSDWPRCIGSMPGDSARVTARSSRRCWSRTSRSA